MVPDTGEVSVECAPVFCDSLVDETDKLGCLVKLWPPGWSQQRGWFVALNWLLEVSRKEARRDTVKGSGHLSSSRFKPLCIQTPVMVTWAATLSPMSMAT